MQSLPQIRSAVKLPMNKSHVVTAKPQRSSQGWTAKVSPQPYMLRRNKVNTNATLANAE